MVNSNNYAHEKVFSNSIYPKEYKGSKPLLEQIALIEKQWGLNGSHARSFVVNLKGLPEGAEGWFAIPKVSAVAKQFPTITDKAEQYCEVVKLVHRKLADSRSFRNCLNGEILPSKLRQHAHTVDCLERLETEQQGDILIIAVQHGRRHRGKSVRRARETFADNEFGLGAFAIGCMALVHPERYVRSSELDPDCAGDEFFPHEDGNFLKIPVFYVGVGGLRFDTRHVASTCNFYGSVSAFIPQN